MLENEKNEMTEETAEAAGETAEAEAPEVKKTAKDGKKESAKVKLALAEAEKELEAQRLALEEQKEKYLRMAAEYENFRKRSAKEKESIYKDAVADTVSEILPVFDNLERAAQYQATEQVAQGLELITKSAEAMLTKLGVEKFGAAGDDFDPNLHNAVMHVEDEAFGENKIAEVFQTGYRMGDKVVRHAMVKVAN